VVRFEKSIVIKRGTLSIAVGLLEMSGGESEYRMDNEIMLRYVVSVYTTSPPHFRGFTYLQGELQHVPNPNGLTANKTNTGSGLEMCQEEDIVSVENRSIICNHL
jgi:hypothetical protein